MNAIETFSLFGEGFFVNDKKTHLPLRCDRKNRQSFDISIYVLYYKLLPMVLKLKAGGDTGVELPMSVPDISRFPKTL